METLFHLAFPVHDFNLAKYFYHEQLGFSLGRESEHALIFNFANHQIVAHLIDEPLPLQASIYPRHFGLIFLKEEEFKKFHNQLINKKVPFEIALKKRFLGTKIEHQTFFIKDPSNNLLEFKYYHHYSAIFNEKNFKNVGEKL
ncbi:Glyoxalase/Bleomycin resistance family protein [Legionella busanensis]|uniref:Glyoxalase/Bleomycin resistance family protein n=1 Tax=Legionella busanensis TaxID=190655 RepID=A0A378JLM3_9GAMM|nr:VOC family protein [Legionella busanensis]STX51109.1 Glyoxalase/Bleomycin resistance family protein [Legionella busanensis]